MKGAFTNPFRPGAGHRPPFLAGRQPETREFSRLLGQDVILENFILTGLRGVGKTVLLDDLKPRALEQEWLWVGADLSESSSISEERLVLRLLTDLAVMTSRFRVMQRDVRSIGFGATPAKQDVHLDFKTLKGIHDLTPGLPSDKLKAVLEVVWSTLESAGQRGVIFAYDEAQNLSDHAVRDEFPASLLLDVFQSIQKRNVPFMLALVGLPTLFQKLVEARTFAERMFRVIVLDKLDASDCRDAILKPIEDASCPIRLDEPSVESIIEVSGGYPYFVQFICREVYDVFVQGQTSVPVHEILQKLDSDFFAGHWARATDRQRDLLTVISHLRSASGEFTVQEIVKLSREKLEKPFSASHVNQMLATLSAAGLVYKNRHGKYSFAVPLLHRFILRQDEL